MKKFLISIFAMLAFGSTAYAKGDNTITVDDVTLSKGGNASALLVNLNLTEKNSAKGMMFTIELPTGVEFVKGNDDKPVYQMGSMFNSAPTLNLKSARKLTFTNASSATVTGSKGLLIAFKIKATGSFTDGEEFEGNISEVSASINGNPVDLAGSSFKITITNCDVVLDENSPFAPEKTSSPVSILLKRTLTAGQWSTLCLPFDIPEDDVETIFGAGVQVAEFVSYSSDDNFETMSIDFESYTGDLSRKNVYLIKTTETKTQFEINARVRETKAGSVEYDETYTGYFIGTYVADTTVPKDALFISDNKFYYSIGSTKIKGFRGYFDFDEKLQNNNGAETRAFFSIDGEGTTKIQNAQISKNETGKVYSISGKYMGEKVNMKSLPKGVYVVDGVKVINK